MATNQMNRNTRLAATGENYGRLTVYSAVAIIITVLFVAAMWFGYYYNPLNNVLGGEEAQPLRQQIPLEVMPALPETLEEEYDAYTAGEIERLNTFEYVDEENGIVRIPVDQAQAIMLEEGFPVRSDTEAASASEAD